MVLTPKTFSKIVMLTSKTFSKIVVLTPKTFSKIVVLTPEACNVNNRRWSAYPRGTGGRRTPLSYRPGGAEQ